ncbi:hypothetical protein IID19_02955 [Patescibacteria group bacterium]|nr:hypothetical protein [Patescibacteria group bacterium]
MLRFKKKLSPIESLLSDRSSQILLVVGLLFNISAWIYLLINIKPQADLIFLHYNIYFGVDLIGDWYRIYQIPLIGIIIYFVNLYLSYILYKKGKVISRFLIGVTVFIQVIVLISSYLITQQNI